MLKVTNPVITSYSIHYTKLYDRRAEKLGVQPMCGLEFEWFNFRETPASWAAKKGVDPTPLTPGMFGYSLLRMGDQRAFFNALMDDMLAFGVPRNNFV